MEVVVQQSYVIGNVLVGAVVAFSAIVLVPWQTRLGSNYPRVFYYALLSERLKVQQVRSMSSYTYTGDEWNRAKLTCSSSFVNCVTRKNEQTRQEHAAGKDETRKK